MLKNKSYDWIKKKFLQEMYLMGGFIGQSVMSSKNFKWSVGCVDII